MGASRALKSLDWENIAAECAVENIKWHFNPPTALWYGGWWERMIRTVKQLFKKSLGRACITYEELTTLLCECESVVNGRPLTYVSDDPNELKPLTSSHFIQDIKGNETVDLDIKDAKYLRKRIRYLQSLRDQLRQRFKEEYLAELVRCHKTSNQKKLAPGDNVLIGSDDKRCLNWPLGRVIELFPGKDNIQRIARVRIANREIIRPV
ncbi:uncharacterized protein [Parasteatoda tepidariorum]|uniref:uncharacterized protein n=1 Tax=Parasteatoda tepidariorum TaxID=114398 RepID=UPI0039BD52B7